MTNIPSHSPRRVHNCAVLLFLTIASVLFTLAPNKANAQSSDRAVGVRSNSQVNKLPAQDKRWALIIGIDNYEDSQISPLRGAAKDARVLDEALIQYAGFPKEQIILLTSDQPKAYKPTRGTILRYLSQLQEQVPTDGLLLVAFSGHGIERGGRSFLLPMDGQDLANIDLMEETAINVERVRSAIERTNVSQVILILDSCRNDPSAGKSGESDNIMKESLSRGFDFQGRNKSIKAFVTLYATEIGQRAYEYAAMGQGYFSYTLVEGLKGQAANDNGEVTLAGLLKYVQEQVPKYVLRDLPGKKQVPLVKMDGYLPMELVLSKTAPKVVAAFPPAPVVVRPTTGKLTVISAPSASITVSAVGWNGPTKSGEVPRGDRLYPFSDLPAGRYRVTASLRDYGETSKEIEVIAGEVVNVNLELSPVTYKVSITTNVNSGEIKVSVPGESPRLITIRDRQAFLGDLRPGNYELEITAKEVGYKRISTTLSVTSDLNKYFELKRNLSSLAYSATWTNVKEDWDVPSNWTSNSSRLVMNGKGIAVLRDDSHNNYADCQLTSDIKMVNGSGVTFVVRYLDSQNYYYIQITGGSSDAPHMLQSYIVKDGLKKKLFSNSVGWLAQYLKPDQPIRLIVEMVGNQFKVSMDSDGEIKKMGDIIDPNNVFQSGALGVAALNNEQTEVYGFIITPKQ